MPGRLIYLMGPSGSGKDSLIEAARARLAACGCEVIRRVVTRSPQAAGEDALGVSRETFARMKSEGAFAMHWEANGFEYGIPVQLDEWLAAGRNVLVSGSRAYLQQARERYPDLKAIMLTVTNEELHRRLVQRGRETASEIAARLKRNTLFLDQLAYAQNQGIELLDNSAELSVGVNALLRLVGAGLAPTPSS